MKHTRLGVTKAQVKQMIRAQTENKRYVGSTTGTMSTAGAFVYKSPLAQADDFQDRTGDLIRPIRLDYRAAVADTVDGYGRVIVFQDYMNVGATPAITDVLASANWNAEFNPIYQINGRFKILIDDTFAISSTGERSCYVEHHIKMKGTIGYLGTGATVASAGKGAIFILLISNGSTQGYDVRTTLTYTDA